MVVKASSVASILVSILLSCGVDGFSARLAFQPLRSTATITYGMHTTSLLASTTTEAPTRERTDRNTKSPQRRQFDDDDDEAGDSTSDGKVYGDLEYLQDPSASREMEDPFHILLLDSTYEKPKITVTYVAGSLEYVLNMPFNEAVELSQFARDQGMSCLGTWTREECLSLGKQLQVRDIVCRVVPYVEGGQRGWQAKDATDRPYSHADSQF